MHAESRVFRNLLSTFKEWSARLTKLSFSSGVRSAPANTPSRSRFKPDITFVSPLRRLEKDVWAAADGGVGSSDSEDDALHGEKMTTGTVVNHAVLQNAYGKLDKPGGGQGQVLYDSSDDD